MRLSNLLTTYSNSVEASTKHTYTRVQDGYGLRHDGEQGENTQVSMGVPITGLYTSVFRRKGRNTESKERRTSFRWLSKIAT